MKQTEHWLRLLLAPDVGPVTGAGLLERYGSAAAVTAASPGELRHAGLTEAAIAAISAPEAHPLETALRWLEGSSHHLIGRDDPRYPALLAQCDGAPLALFVRGDPELLAQPQVAIVGSRNPTRGGEDSARQFAASLARSGLTVTSGLAAGIDRAAHEGALPELGGTIAVCAHGLDITYPASNQDLADAIADQGALVSEYLPGTEVSRGRFPQRNRIISGLAAGTLVVEAGIRSGSLITARLAGEQGREVFAIPGSIHSPVSRGCHQLIRGGAKLVEKAADVLAELGPLLATVNSPDAAERRAEPEPLDPAHQELLDAMGWDPCSIDALAQRTRLTTAELSSMLLIQELEGNVEKRPGGLFLRRRIQD